MYKHLEFDPDIEYEQELDERPDDMEDEILTLDENGKPIEVNIEDDSEPEEMEESTDAEYN